MFSLLSGPGSGASAIKDLMTEAPSSVELKSHLLTAMRIMNRGGFRHLPVVDGGEIVGLISERDLHSARYIYRNHDMSEIRVADVCLTEPITVDVEAGCKEVLDRMVSEKVGSVVVEENGKCVGIFTTVDACRLLLKMIKEAGD